MSFVIRYLVYMILSILTSVFAMLAVGNDAKALGVKKRKMFMALSFFFPVIMVIVYVCVRKKTEKIQPKMCNVCHTTVDPSTNICPVCSSVSFTDYQIANNQTYKKRAKVFLIVAICFYIASSAFNYAFSGDIADKLLKQFGGDSSFGQFDENPFKDFNEDYFDNFDLD